MRITLISRSWPSHERSGVSLSAYSHARLLLEQGHEVSIIGAVDNMKSLTDSFAAKSYVQATGSGSLYSPVKINYVQLRNSIADSHPDLVVVEAWQTALTDSAIDAAFELSIPVLMISHGISLHPFQSSLIQYLRSLAWLPYRFLKLPHLMKKLSAITALDDSSTSPRFFDRDLATRFNIPVLQLRNSPIHWSSTFYPRECRKQQILVVGYFSPVKNQMAAIHAIKDLSLEINLCFIGERKGEYFEKCEQAVRQNHLLSRVSFLQDDECSLGEQIASSLLVFSPSITEALPMVLIEAMACGTPYVASSVGAVPNLRGGIVANTPSDQIKAIEQLISDNSLWNRYSDDGLLQYQKEFTESCVGEQLANAVDQAFNIGTRNTQRT